MNSRTHKRRNFNLKISPFDLQSTLVYLNEGGNKLGDIS